MATISTVFFDIGGVVLSNGWDHDQRRKTAEELGFDYAAFDSRHLQVVDSLERGQLSLHDYLQWTLFYEPRPFSEADAVRAIEGLSMPNAATLDLVRGLRQSTPLALMTINNESRELNEYRIGRFGLRALFSAFFSSCYLGLVKPQPELYERALDIAQRAPGECLHIDDRPMNVEVAATLGMHSILFKDAVHLEADLRSAGIAFK
ncbi:MAG TPA: HAD family phosphatase [Anaerolineales bacterium]|nr:HAD family phosphatase [Anaerolineales bacterium]